jgi:hypothetical protein
MRSHLHVDDTGPLPQRVPAADGQWPDARPRYKVRPPWLIFLAKHFAPRNHERYQLQGSEIPQEEWDRAFPRLSKEAEARLGLVRVKWSSEEQVFNFKPVRKRPW